MARPRERAASASPQDQADRHVAKAEQRIAEQRWRIKELAASGHDTSEAEKFLKRMLELLEEMTTHRDAIAARRRSLK